MNAVEGLGRVSVVIQGGAMRSIYCVGAVRALAERGLLSQIGSIHAASAGCVSSVTLTALVSGTIPPDPSAFTVLLISRLASKRFIDSRRIRKVVDVDFLVEVLLEESGLTLDLLKAGGVVSEVALAQSSGSVSYVDIAASASEDELRSALRGTMAIPILYPTPVYWRGQRVFDGGIVDPLPILRATQQSVDTVIAISNVPKSTLGDPPAEGRERVIVQLVPRLPKAIKRRMLTRIELGDQADALLTHGLKGHRLVGIWPSRPELLGHRLEIDKDRLLAVEGLGYLDALHALDAAVSAGNEDPVS
jgi:predicted patatin/cPLA2 family phospholipase